MSKLHEQKQQLRMQMREIIRQISPNERARFSKMVTKKILDLPEYLNAGVIMAFLSMDVEYDTSELISKALSNGKTICAPKVDWKNWTMSPVKISHNDDIIIDDHNLKEPAGDERTSPDEIDLILVPGLAFDIRGHRLGRGGGFYDTFLSRADLRRAIKLAPTFDCQILPHLPSSDKDQTMDIIITPHKLLRFA